MRGWNESRSSQARRLLKPKDTLRVIARAVYSDGTTEDVTRWAKFGSSEDLVAGVNEDGRVTVSGHGEAAIIVSFGTKVTTLTITSPFANAVDASTFAKSPRNNFVDDLVLKKLELLRIPPSGTSAPTPSSFAVSISTRAASFRRWTKSRSSSPTPIRRNARS